MLKKRGREAAVI